MKKKNSYRFLISATSATLVASAIVPVASAASFTDIEQSGDHKDANLALTDLNITSGYPDGSFQPNKKVTRGNVVKFLGKWLVSEGYTIPEGYQTTQRFDDLPLSTKDTELLGYAALVKDAGVFKGNNNKLNASALMPRQQMALVLTRAIDSVYGVDLVAIAQEENFESKITDISSLIDEKIDAIEALEFAKITKVTEFRPSGDLSRAQFASFLHRTITNVEDFIGEEKLTVKGAKVMSATLLEVTLSDDSVHQVTLEKALEENEETTVKFVIDEVEYEATVTYVVEALKVKSIKAINGTQVEVVFNQEIDPTSVSKDAVKLSNIDTFKDVAIDNVKVSDAKKSIILTTAVNEILSIEEDKTAPSITGQTSVKASVVKVKFSEPMRAFANAGIQFTLADGTKVTGITGAVAQLATDVDFDLSAAKANGKELAPGTEVKVTFVAARDIAGNLITPNPATITLKKAEKDGVAPTVTSIKQTGAKSFQIVFSEAVLKVAKEDIEVKKGGQALVIDTVVQDATAKNVVHVTLDAVTEGLVTVSTAATKVITDASGETATFTQTITFTKDVIAPTVTATEVVVENNVEYLQLTFDKAV
ncbi:MAG: S-layer homology domain-containing protein [Lysinibacillus sp.]